MSDKLLPTSFILIVMFMYSYRYVCSIPCILFLSCQLAFSGYPD